MCCFSFRLIQKNIKKHTFLLERSLFFSDSSLSIDPQALGRSLHGGPLSSSDFERLLRNETPKLWLFDARYMPEAGRGVGRPGKIGGDLLCFFGGGGDVSNFFFFFLGGGGSGFLGFVFGCLRFFRGILSFFIPAVS